MKSSAYSQFFASMMYGMVWSTNTWKIRILSNITVWDSCFQNGRFWSTVLLYTWHSEMSLHQSGTMRSDCHSTSRQPNRSKIRSEMVRNVRIVWLNIPWACWKLHFQVSLWCFPSLPLHLPTSRVAARPSASSLSAAVRSVPVVQHAGAGPWQPRPRRKGSTHLLATLARYETTNLHGWSHRLQGLHAVSETIWLPPTHVALRPEPSQNTLISLPYHTRPKSNSTINMP